MSAARAKGHRKPAAFKPPRPTQNKASKYAQNGAIVKPSARSESLSKTGLDKQSRSGFRPASHAIELSDDEASEDEGDGENVQESENGDSANSDVDPPSASSNRLARPPPSPSAAALPASEDAPPPIPQKLLTKLLHENFDDKGTRIGKDAMAVVAKYMELFVREAIARAAVERDGEAGDGLGDGFLEVSLALAIKRVMLSRESEVSGAMAR
ncbi:MAG: hypothetical protein M1821_009847 [Bathelium mastoideum]|nr:MAG: hypothetical protein M1821_009847 [Bathelium mastoideum]KAI9690395.1 MAG: hypothetical protein M1822_009358 [Bathelium mastoideum]